MIKKRAKARVELQILAKESNLNYSNDLANKIEMLLSRCLA